MLSFKLYNKLRKNIWPRTKFIIDNNWIWFLRLLMMPNEKSLLCEKLFLVYECVENQVKFIEMFCISERKFKLTLIHTFVMHCFSLNA
jgi:hypothetical protein